jgi:cytochrome c oxidase cbb3-type subunit 3
VNLFRQLWSTAALSTTLLAALFVAQLAGCTAPPGRPRKGSETLGPDQIMDFATLYSENCAGCHGPDGRGGAAIALGDPIYLAIADDLAIRNVTTKGVAGTSMPAFAQSAGGMLAAKQIDVIISEIRSRWSKPGILAGINPPSYAAKSHGNPTQGAAVFKTYCESCHGPGGRGGPKGSAITKDAFLELVSDQGLRTVVITGRPELGAPDWRGNVPGKPMSDLEITDVVAWLASQRPQIAPPSSSASKSAQH